MDKKKEEGVMDLTPLMDVVRTLRSPGGCPWDQAQDHKSMRRELVEEVYELLEAIDDGDVKGIRKSWGMSFFRWSSMPVWQKKWGPLRCRTSLRMCPGNSSTVIPMFMVRLRSEARRSFSRIGMPSKQKRKRNAKVPLMALPETCRA